MEHTILCEAGRIVSRDTVAYADKRGEMLVSAYKETLSSLRQDLFESQALRDDMLRRQKGGHLQGGMKSRTLWDKWTVILKEMKKIFANLPQNYHTMKSGIQLYNVHEGVVRQHYKEAYVSLTYRLLLHMFVLQM